MTYRDVYIGRAPDDSSNTEHSAGEIDGLPECLGPYFPPAAEKDPFFELQDRILTGRMLGKQVDWGAWAAVVTKSEIEEFVLEIYGKAFNPKRMPHLVEDYRKLTKAVTGLINDRSYVLVALES